MLMSLARVHATPQFAAAAVACAQTACDLHFRLFPGVWKKGLRALQQLRSDLEPSISDWPKLEQTVAEQRTALLAQATQIEEETWKHFSDSTSL